MEGVRGRGGRVSEDRWEGVRGREVGGCQRGGDGKNVGRLYLVEWTGLRTGLRDWTED